MTGTQAKKRRWHRHWWLGAVAAVVIVLGLLVGAAGLLFPWLLAHPERVRVFLSAQLQRPLEFASLSGRWRAKGPVFTMNQLRIGGENGEPALLIERAELGFDFYAFLHSDRAWHELGIVAPVFDVERSAGQWRVRQWHGASFGEGSFDLSALKQLGAILLRSASINIRDVDSGSHLALRDVEVRIDDSARGHSLRASLRTEAATASIRMKCSTARGFAAGQCYLRGEQLQLADWLSTWPLLGIRASSGRADLDAWVEYTGFRPIGVRADVELHDADFHGATGADLVAPVAGLRSQRTARSALAVDWHSPQAGSWRLRFLEGDSPQALNRADAASGVGSDLVSRLQVEHDGAGNGRQDRVRIDALRLDRLLPWLAVSNALPSSLASALAEAEPHGVLRSAQWVGDGLGRWRLQGEVQGLGWRSVGKLPGLDGVSGRFEGDQQAVVLSLERVQTMLRGPGLLRRPLALRLQPFSIGWQNLAPGFRIAVDGLDADIQGAALAAQLALDFLPDGGRPTVDAMLNLQPMDLTAVKPVLPIGVMATSTVEWLDRALLAGSLHHASVVLRGDLDDWPFADGQGRFDAVTSFGAAEIDYTSGWPAAKIDLAHVQFSNNRMQVQVSAANVLGNRIENATVAIADLGHPQLDVDVQSRGFAENLLALIHQSPLEQQFADEIGGLSMHGRADTRMAMRLPLGKTAGELQIDGRVELIDTDLAESNWKLRFDQVNGPVLFTRTGFGADRLTVLVDSAPARLSLALGEFTSDPDQHLEGRLSGELPVASVFAPVAAMASYFDRFSGKAYWDVALDVGHGHGLAPAEKRLSVRSDLRGIESRLPAPLGKDAESALPFKLNLGVPPAGSRLSMQLGELLRVEGSLPDSGQPLALHAAFGGELPEPDPQAGVRITGAVTAADLIGWATLVGTGSGDREGTGVSLSADLHAEQLDLFGRSFANSDIKVRGKSPSTRISLHGDGIDGDVDVVAGGVDPGGITAQFATLHWPEADPHATATGASTTDPARIPPLHASIVDLKLGRAHFGRTRIETRPDAEGMRIEEMDTQSPELTMRATGQWSLIDGVESSALDINFSAEDVGKMLHGLGYDSAIAGGQTIARLQGRWTGSPAGFALEKVVGTLTGEVGEGRFLDVNPGGAGRLFGLANFGAIPRRLTLDFKDLFESGMAFDSIRGSFTLDLGNASTTDLKIKAPSAKILIRGRAGISARDYDQEMIVIPHVRSTLPLVGAVAAGPVGVIIGVLAKDVLKKPLEQLSAVRYHVGGSWDKPDIVFVRKERVAADSVGE
ncbi:MAG: YhdP family protein [Lysobacterales bacterium]